MPLWPPSHFDRFRRLGVRYRLDPVAGLGTFGAARISALALGLGAQRRCGYSWRDSVSPPSDGAGRISLSHPDAPRGSDRMEEWRQRQELVPSCSTTGCPGTGSLHSPRPRSDPRAIRHGRRTFPGRLVNDFPASPMNPEPGKPVPVFSDQAALLFGVLLLATVLALVWAFEGTGVGERRWQALVQPYAARGDRSTDPGSFRQ